MHRYLLSTAVLVAALLAPQAHASTMTYDISFTASGAVAASGEYLLTFDATKNVKKDTTTGLSVLSFSDMFAPPATTAFNYVGGSLVIGGLTNTVDTVSSGTNDYLLEIDNFLTTPTFGGFFAASATDKSNVYVDNVGSVKVSAVAPTPEPSSLALLGTGVLGMVGAVRRRWA